MVNICYLGDFEILNLKICLIVIFSRCKFFLGILAEVRVIYYCVGRDGTCNLVYAAGLYQSWDLIY